MPPKEAIEERAPPLAQANSGGVNRCAGLIELHNLRFYKERGLRPGSPT